MSGTEDLLDLAADGRFMLAKRGNLVLNVDEEVRAAIASWRPIKEHPGHGSPDVIVGCWIRLPGIRPYFYRTVAHPSDGAHSGWWNVSADEDLDFDPDVFMWMPDDPPAPLSGRLAEDPAPDAASGMPSNPVPDLLEKGDG